LSSARVGGEGFRKAEKPFAEQKTQAQPPHPLRFAVQMNVYSFWEEQAEKTCFSQVNTKFEIS
jgi:hypothetical protein